MARRISKARSNAIKHGYRSGFEHKVADQLKESKTKFEYETTVIEYIKPKGKIRKGSKTTYADFCEKHGIVWAEKEIPTDWLK